MRYTYSLKAVILGICTNMFVYICNLDYKSHLCDEKYWNSIFYICRILLWNTCFFHAGCSELPPWADCPTVSAARFGMATGKTAYWQ